MESSTNTKQILLNRAKFAQKKLFFCVAILDPFISKSFQILDHFFPFPPKDFESLKMLDILLQEMGAKRQILTDGRTDGHTVGRTDRHTDGDFDL